MGVEDTGAVRCQNLVMLQTQNPSTDSATSVPHIDEADPRRLPNHDEKPGTFVKPRLNQDDVAYYCRDGYMLYNKPVLRRPQFEGFKSHFEMLLEEHTKTGLRPEAMDTPHFGDHRLFDWIFSDEMFDLVQPLVGPNIALFSSHFLAKPAGSGKRVPWHEDSFYWRDLMEPMHVCTVWLCDRSVACRRTAA